jgi:hypothetical protein
MGAHAIFINCSIKKASGTTLPLSVIEQTCLRAENSFIPNTDLEEHFSNFPWKFFENFPKEYINHPDTKIISDAHGQIHSSDIVFKEDNSYTITFSY